MARILGLALLLVASAALAGCSGGSGDGNGDGGAGTPPSTGVLRGLVVDPALMPVADASVTLKGVGVEQDSASDAAGLFRFEGLAPGTYFVVVEKAGYARTQQSREVRAGDDDPELLKVLLGVDPRAVPSFEVMHFEGFLECNATAVIFFVPCDDPTTGDPIGNNQYETDWPLSSNATWVHVSLVWEPTQPFGTELYFNLLEPNGYTIVAFNGGVSPLTADANETVLQPLNAAHTVGIEVAGNGEQGVAGVNLQQSFDAYVVVFHNFTPPEGYAFWRDGNPRLPA